MKLKDIVLNVENLVMLFDLNFNTDTQWKLSKVMSKVQEELNIFNEVKNKKLKQFKIDENSSQENVSLYNNEINKLLEMDVDLKFDKVTYSEVKKSIDKKKEELSKSEEVGDKEKLKAYSKPSFFYSLHWFIE